MFMLILTPFLPESPRWRTYSTFPIERWKTDYLLYPVLLKDRPAEAWKILARLHGAGKETETSSAAGQFAREEFYQMSQQVQADKVMAAGESLMTLFTKPSYRKRMICAFLTMFGAESTGILVVYSVYIPACLLFIPI